MHPDTVISRILARIDAGASPASLIDAAAASDLPELHAGARAAFGSWDAALAATLIHLRNFYETLNRPEVDDSDGESASDEPPPERVVTSAAGVTAWLLTRSGQALTHDLQELAPTDEPVLHDALVAGDPRHALCRVQVGDGDSGVVLVTQTGKALAVDQRLLASWAAGAPARLLMQRFEGLESGDEVVAAIPRAALRAQPRFYTVSAHGNLKATDCDELRRIGSDATVAALVRDGDVLVDAFTGPVDAQIFVAASHARAIVFDAGEVRSQGRKATGVRAIALDGDAKAVGGFALTPGAWVVLATQTGLVKRMRGSDFRPQGRAGGGLQSCRLQGTDRVACVGRVGLADDAVLVTSQGRWARFPAYAIPFGARSARGERIVDLGPGETIVSIEGVPAGAFA